MRNRADTVRTEFEGGIARLSLARPDALNAIDESMAVALLRAVREVLSAPGLRVVVLRGEGRAFMAGGDIQAFHREPGQAAATARKIIGPLHEAVSLLTESSAPWIACLHGAVAGAGLSLALDADLVIAADNTRFSPAYARIGASPDGGGSWSLPRKVGLSRALEIALLAEPFDAAQALAWGIVNRVVPVADLSAQTDALARLLAQGPTAAYGHTKRLLRHAHERTLKEQLAAESEAFAACAATRSFREGIEAFVSKRPAQFSGD